MKKIFAILLCACALASCRSNQDFLYLKDMDEGVLYPSKIKNEVKILPGDKLKINVTCKNPELAIPFNATVVGVGTDGSVQPSGIGMDYRVDPEGNIDFPILGQLHVEGLTIQQIRKLISDKIEAGDYIKNPIVKVELLNLKYTVLGAVGSNGNYSTDEGRITLVEAIAQAGDVTASGRVDRVLVIREEEGGRRTYVNDLRSKDIFTSPCYYLQQNDIVYVEPKRKKDTRAQDNAFKYTTLTLSFVSAVCAVIWALK